MIEEFYSYDKDGVDGITNKIDMLHQMGYSIVGISYGGAGQHYLDIPTTRSFGFNKEPCWIIVAERP